jgi:hypothetical protein
LFFSVLRDLPSGFLFDTKTAKAKPLAFKKQLAWPLFCLVVCAQGASILILHRQKADCSLNYF